MSVLAVWTMEKIGAQCRCTTGSKLPEHPQLVGAQLEQMEQKRVKKRAGCRPRLTRRGQPRRCSAPMDRASPCQSARGGLARSDSSVCAYCPMQPLLIRSKGECTSASLRAVTWR